MDMPRPGPEHKRLVSRLQGSSHHRPIENRFPDQTDFSEFMHGDYRHA